MKEAWDFNRAAAILEDETELLKKISIAQAAVRQAVIDREWADFDEKTLEVNNLGAEFVYLEEERAKLFSILHNESGFCADEEIPFNSLIEEIPEEEKKELKFLYRELKMEIYKIKALNEIFIDYLNEAKTLAAAYINTVCPARGGQLYTRRGRTVTPDLRSVVINNCF